MRKRCIWILIGLLSVLLTGCAQVETGITVDGNHNVMLTVDVTASAAEESDLYLRLGEALGSLGMTVRTQGDSLHGEMAKSFSSAADAAAYLNGLIAQGALPFDRGGFETAETAYGAAYRFEASTDYSAAAGMAASLELPSGLMEGYREGGVQWTVTVSLPALELRDFSGEVTLERGLAVMRQTLSPQQENRLYLSTLYAQENAAQTHRALMLRRTVFLIVTGAGMAGVTLMAVLLLAENRRQKLRRQRRAARRAAQQQEER